MKKAAKILEQKDNSKGKHRKKRTSFLESLQKQSQLFLSRPIQKIPNLSKALGKSYKKEYFQNNPKWDYLFVGKKEESPQANETAKKQKANEQYNFKQQNKTEQKEQAKKSQKFTRKDGSAQQRPNQIINNQEQKLKNKMQLQSESQNQSENYQPKNTSNQQNSDKRKTIFKRGRKPFNQKAKVKKSESEQSSSSQQGDSQENSSSSSPSGNKKKIQRGEKTDVKQKVSSKNEKIQATNKKINNKIFEQRNESQNSQQEQSSSNKESSSSDARSESESSPSQNSESADKQQSSKKSSKGEIQSSTLGKSQLKKKESSRIIEQKDQKQKIIEKSQNLDFEQSKQKSSSQGSEQSRDNEQSQESQQQDVLKKAVEQIKRIQQEDNKPVRLQTLLAKRGRKPGTKNNLKFLGDLDEEPAQSRKKIDTNQQQRVKQKQKQPDKKHKSKTLNQKHLQQSKDQKIQQKVKPKAKQNKKIVENFKVYQKKQRSNQSSHDESSRIQQEKDRIILYNPITKTQINPLIRSRLSIEKKVIVESIMFITNDKNNERLGVEEFIFKQDSFEKINFENEVQRRILSEEKRKTKLRLMELEKSESHQNAGLLSEFPVYESEILRKLEESYEKKNTNNDVKSKISNIQKEIRKSRKKVKKDEFIQSLQLSETPKDTSEDKLKKLLPSKDRKKVIVENEEQDQISLNSSDWEKIQNKINMDSQNRENHPPKDQKAQSGVEEKQHQHEQKPDEYSKNHQPESKNDVKIQQIIQTNKTQPFIKQSKLYMKKIKTKVAIKKDSGESYTDSISEQESEWGEQIQKKKKKGRGRGRPPKVKQSQNDETQTAAKQTPTKEKKSRQKKERSYIKIKKVLI